MRILGVDYSNNKDALVICITSNINGNMRVVHVETIKDVISEEQAIELCKCFYKIFDCDKIMSENLKINLN